MKNEGAYFEYEEQRNRNLLEVFQKVAAANMDKPLPEIYRLTVMQPAERFWVSEERASIVISSIMKGDKLTKMRPTKKKMYLEIYRRVKGMREMNPGESLYSLVFDVVNSPAPEFYITPGSAKVIIHKIKHKWYEERKRKYRHLFM